MEEFKTFYDQWRKDPEHIGVSFTHGCAFYDYMKNRLPYYMRQDEREQIERGVQGQYGFTQDQTEMMPTRALLELCDISILDEICNHLFFNDNEDEDTTEQ